MEAGADGWRPKLGALSITSFPAPPLQREGAGTAKGKTTPSVNISSRPPAGQQLRSIRCADRIRSAALHYRTSAPVQSEVGVGRVW